MGKGSSLTGGLGDFMNEATGGDEVSKYGGLIAMSQQREAQRQYDEYKDRMGTATVAGLASLDQDIGRQEKNLARQEQLISSIDPTVMEASQQALKLLRGEESSTLAPVRAQRDMQRQKLLAQLREQLGPGAETSTAGIQALTRFDMETSSLMANTQQSALQGLGNTAGQFNSVRPDMFREIMGMSGLGQQKYGLRANEAGGLLQAGSPLIGMSGARYAGDLMNAQNKQAHLNALHESGMAIGQSFATMGMGGGSAPKVASPGQQKQASSQVSNANYEMDNSGSSTFQRPSGGYLG